jgi:hypothetical protein
LLIVYYKEQLLSDDMFRPLFLRPSSGRKYLYQGKTVQCIHYLIYVSDYDFIFITRSRFVNKFYVTIQDTKYTIKLQDSKMRYIAQFAIPRFRILRVFLSSYVYLLHYVCIAALTLDAGLLARSQYPEGPATGHLDTGFSRFPCVYKRMLRWFPSFQVATTCLSCSPPDLNFLVTYFIVVYM